MMPIRCHRARCSHHLLHRLLHFRHLALLRPLQLHRLRLEPTAVATEAPMASPMVARAPSRRLCLPRSRSTTSTTASPRAAPSMTVASMELVMQRRTYRCHRHRSRRRHRPRRRRYQRCRSAWTPGRPCSTRVAASRPSLAGCAPASPCERRASSAAGSASFRRPLGRRRRSCRRRSRLRRSHPLPRPHICLLARPPGNLPRSCPRELHRGSHQAFRHHSPRPRLPCRRHPRHRRPRHPHRARRPRCHRRPRHRHACRHPAPRHRRRLRRAFRRRPRSSRRRST